MGGQSTRLSRACCCCLQNNGGAGAAGDASRAPCSVAGHPPSCRCSAPSRRWIDASAPSRETFDGADDDSMDDEYEEGMGEQRALVRDTGPAPYGMSGGGGFDSRGGTPARPRNVRHSSGGSSGAYGHSNGALESDTGDELDFRHDLDDAEPAAANLTEAQIQALIQQQVARLSARLNELDDELAEAEEDCEIEAEQQEQQRTTRTNR